MPSYINILKVLKILQFFSKFCKKILIYGILIARLPDFQAESNPFLYFSN